MKQTGGHRWNEFLECRCGMNYAEHRTEPRRCRLVPSGVPREVSYLSEVALRRMVLGFTLRTVAQETGSSRRQVSRVERGLIGGKGGVSVAVTDRVLDFLGQS